MKNVRPVIDGSHLAQIQNALDIRGSRYGLLWRLGVSTGLRISDLLNIRRMDIHGSRLIVLEKKTGKIRKIVFDQETMNAINAHVRNHRLLRGHYLFFRSRLSRDTPMSRQWARTVIAQTGVFLGIESLGTHSMRKTFACALYRSTGSKEAVQYELNHSKVETTLLYLRDMQGTTAATGRS